MKHASGDHERERLIRERAYLIWEQQGRPDGRAHEHWHEAAAQVAEQRSDAPAPAAAPAATRKPAARKPATARKPTRT